MPKTSCLMIVLSVLLMSYHCGASGPSASGREDGPLKEVARRDFGPAYDVVVVNKIAYVTGNRGVHIIDVENPGSPPDLSRLKLNDGAFGISIKSQRAFTPGTKRVFLSPISVI